MTKDNKDQSEFGLIPNVCKGFAMFKKATITVHGRMKPVTTAKIQTP